MTFKLICLGLLLMTTSFAGASEAVRYAGFCFSGSYQDIPQNYPHCHALTQIREGGRNILDKLFYDFFQVNPSFRNFYLDLETASQTGKALAISINRESVDTETISGQTKLIYNLGFSLYILDFDEMKVLQSYPFRIGFIELYPEYPSRERINAQILKLIQEQLLPSILSRMPQIAIRPSGNLTLKVASVEINPDALSALGPYAAMPAIYSTILANHLTESMAFGLNVAMLPYARDFSTQKMALAFSDASMLNFSIPPASYDIDLRLDKFHKALFKETAFERVDIYGAYVNMLIYDAELGTQYWQQDVKWGATKQTVAGQETDDFANYHEVLLKTIGTELIETIRKDKTLMENKKNKKGVIIRCANF